jgi:hypothetical protein
MNGNPTAMNGNPTARNGNPAAMNRNPAASPRNRGGDLARQILLQPAFKLGLEAIPVEKIGIRQ